MQLIGEHVGEVERKKTATSFISSWSLAGKGPTTFSDMISINTSWEDSARAIEPVFLRPRGLRPIPALKYFVTDQPSVCPVGRSLSRNNAYKPGWYHEVWSHAWWRWRSDDVIHVAIWSLGPQKC